MDKEEDKNNVSKSLIVRFKDFIKNISCISQCCNTTVKHNEHKHKQHRKH